MGNPVNLALLMIKEVRDALTSGTKHYRISDNKLLTTDKEIIEALVLEGKIAFEPTQRTNVG